ncbi:unnamed protein product [Camellia sinensis]
MEEASEHNKKQSVPVLPWMRSPIDVSLFDECPLNLLPFLDRRLEVALENMGFTSLFPVQVAVWQETIGPGSCERDLCINSPTGSGKTLAYALPIVQMLSTRAVRCLRVLVVLPTRDLAVLGEEYLKQGEEERGAHVSNDGPTKCVKEVFAAIAPAVSLSVGLAVGQSSIADEISELIKRPKLEAGICYDPEDLSLDLESSVDILVATPGRLMDHINSTKGFTLEHLCYLVVEETDRLLREAYQSWLPTVLQLIQSSVGSLFPHANTFFPSPFGYLKTRRRSIRESLRLMDALISLFYHWIKGVERGFKGNSYPRLVKMVLSATLTQDPCKLAQLNLHHPLSLTTGQRRYQLPEQLESFKLRLLGICESKHKPLYLVALLQTLQEEKCIVFTSSVESTHRLCTLLNFFGDLQIKIKEYSGLQRQFVRSKTLRAFREGEIQVLVSSDAMTRGMDVEGVRNVINHDVPAYIKTYIHRAGRTARAEVKRFKKLLQKADNNYCPVHSVPSDSIESFRSTYTSGMIVTHKCDLQVGSSVGFQKLAETNKVK